jgi:hypothetical protein
MLFRLLLPSINRHPEFINPLALYLDHAPTRDLPATFPYCCPVTVLEWKIGYSIVLPPVADWNLLFSILPTPQDIEQWPKPYSLYGIMSNEASSPGMTIQNWQSKLSMVSCQLMQRP